MRSIGWTTSILIAQAVLWLGSSEFNPAIAQGRGGTTAASRTATGYWTHNGSVMSLVTDGKTQKFIYHTPRIGLLDAGVKPGTLLFEGRRTGQALVGTAYQFYRTCKPRGFRVTGTASDDQKQIVLKGKAPLLDVNCKVAGTRDDVLVFTANLAVPTGAAADAKAPEVPAANSARQVASRGPVKEELASEPAAAKAEEARAPVAPLPDASKTKADAIPNQASTAAAAKEQAEPENDKSRTPKAEPAATAVASDKPAQEAQTGAAPAPEINVAAAVPANQDQSAAPAIAAKTPKPDKENADAPPRQSGETRQAESGLPKSPTIAAAVKDSGQTEDASKAKAEGPAVGGQAPKGSEATGGTAPHQPPQTAQPAPAESKAGASPAAGSESSQADDSGKAKAAAREVAAAAEVTAAANAKARQDGATPGIAPNDQAAAPQAESTSTKVATGSPAAVNFVNGDAVEKAKTAGGKAAGSLQTALKPPPSRAEGDRTGAVGENRTAGSNERNATAPSGQEKMMEIVLKNGRILRIGRDVDLEVLARIVTMLER